MADQAGPRHGEECASASAGSTLPRQPTISAPPVNVPMVEENSDQVFAFEGKNSDLAKMYQCPGCSNVMLPPIYLCEKGHSICSACRTNLVLCPTCWTMVCSVRNWVAEGLLELGVVKCKFARNGCTVARRGSEMVRHQEVCEFKQGLNVRKG